MIRFFSAFAIIATLMTSQTSNFEVQEATIADIHRALASRRITCPQLVQKYLDRIDAYDKKGPAVNAIITVNSKALDEARAMEAEIARAGITKPLQCIPVAVKDNFETIGLSESALIKLAYLTSRPRIIDGHRQVRRHSSRNPGPTVLAFCRLCRRRDRRRICRHPKRLCRLLFRLQRHRPERLGKAGIRGEDRKSS